MKELKTDLSTYDNSWYDPGGGSLKRFLWYFTNIIFFLNPLNPVSSLKVAILRSFGARVGKGVVIKPSVNIKYPWHLEIGDYAWIGENVWIDNLDKVTIGANACLSQGALILSGNHNFKKTTFDLIVKPITIGEGAWIGAKATVSQGVTCGSHSVLTVGSVASGDLEPFGIYRGNPAELVKMRKIEA